MKKSIVLCICLATNFAWGTTPDSAQTLVKNAVAKAQGSQKHVLVVFRATWCKWCTRLEKAFENPEINKIIDDHFVVATLNVFERGDKVQTYENPGAREIITNFGNKDSGLPFLAFLDAKGTLIANSNVMPGKQNIGYPGSKEEIAAFLKVLKKTAPRMTNAQRTTISNYLNQNAPR